MNEKQRTRLLIIIATLLTIAGTTWYIITTRHPFWQRIVHTKNMFMRSYDKRQPWITVFVHGNFNTGLGLLSLPNVIKDALKGTSYATASKQLRRDPFFFQDQPIGQEGLHRIHPTFIHVPFTKKYAALPIIKAYDVIGEHVYPNHAKNYYYTFGWSGMLSKTRRQREAFRLYNALQSELAYFKKIGITPRVRLIAHSHGGNLSLHLAAINDVLEKKSIARDDPRSDTYRAIQIIAESLPHKNQQPAKRREKYEYYPEHTNLVIDELAMLGTPIQNETAPYAMHSTFKRMYSLYSSQDVVQILDVISTKYESLQRFVFPKEQVPTVTQARIMVDGLPRTHAAYEKTSYSWWERISALFSSEESKDPTHKNLWFFAWNQEYCQKNFPLNPLPIVILLPAFQKLLSQTDLRDVDINLRFDEKHMHLELLQHNADKVIQRLTLPRTLISTITEQCEEWRPEEVTRENAFERVMRSIQRGVA